MPGHTLKVILECDTVCLSIECHEADGARCRKACSQECEYACADPDAHVRPVSFCLAAEWVADGNCMEELYAGQPNELLLLNGMPIDIRWDGFREEWQWKAVGIPWREDSEIPEAVNS